MTKIHYKAKATYHSKTTPMGIAALLDTGSENCYIDYEIAKYLKIDCKKLPKTYVGLGYRRIRHGPIYCGFITKFKKNYKGMAKTYITDFSKDTFDILLSGNWIKESKLPVQKIIERSEKYEY